MVRSHALQVSVLIYIYIERERERERENSNTNRRPTRCTRKYDIIIFYWMII